MYAPNEARTLRVTLKVNVDAGDDRDSEQIADSILAMYGHNGGDVNLYVVVDQVEILEYEEV